MPQVCPSPASRTVAAPRAERRLPATTIDVAPDLPALPALPARRPDLPAARRARHKTARHARRWSVALVGVPLLIAGCSDDGPSGGARADVPTALEARSALQQVGPVGAAVDELPAVRALQQDGSPAVGVQVRFIASAGSDAAPSTVTTGSDGIARLTTWTLSAGESTVRAEVAALPPVTFRAEGRPRGYNIVVRWQGVPSAAAQAAVAAAEATLERIIWEDLPDERVSATPVCFLQGAAAAVIDEEIDDLLVIARHGPIDGAGGAGAQGFPCLIRDPGAQPLVGFIRFDEADFDALPANIQRGFALHELVHALGFVPQLLNITLPSGFARRCLMLPSTGAPNTLVQDSHFSCANAVAAFDRAGGTRYAGPKVPLENGATRPLTGNTLNHHWRKTTFTSELMTGWFTVADAPLSAVTVGMLADLGYAVSYSGADPFTFGATIDPNVSLPSVNRSAGAWHGPTSTRELQLAEPDGMPPVRVLSRVPRRAGRTPESR